MIEINEGDFHAPMSPRWCDHYRYFSSDSYFGKRLAENARHFYAWYLSRDINPEMHTKTFELLCKIMQIAHISQSGGYFLTAFEEKDALQAFAELSDTLFYRKIENGEINERLAKILSNITENNVKAKMISYITSVEYLVNIRNEDIVPENVLVEFKNQLTTMINEVNPNLPDIHAEAISRCLKELIDKPQERFEDMLVDLKNICKQWLNL